MAVEQALQPNLSYIGYDDDVLYDHRQPRYPFSDKVAEVLNNINFNSVVHCS